MKKLVSIIVFLFLTTGLIAQTPAFRKEINAFLKSDSVSMPAKGQTLFVGSSSFTFWKDVQQYFPNHSIINRGFGGSGLRDLIRYADEIIIPYQPKQIIIYCGENDLADSVGTKPRQVLRRYKTLISIIRKKLKHIPVVFISIKPSPSRWKLEPVFVQTNKLIKRWVNRDHQSRYVDVHGAMLLTDGSVNPELFIKDNLHMNAKGYAIWQKLIEPVLM